MTTSSSSSSAAVGRILRLDETVVNRIAAGEIIHRPCNALKELLENSIDAGADSITVTLAAGGCKLLQVADNGHGIRKSDLPILCERFTTSKLREIDDLNGIATFGFRGEALASVSHVAHLSVTTRTASDKCAFKATYSDGSLLTPPGITPLAGNVGTVISAEDLFYNVPMRRNALRPPSEEYAKCLEVHVFVDDDWMKYNTCITKDYRPEQVAAEEKVDFSATTLLHLIDTETLLYVPVCDLATQKGSSRRCTIAMAYGDAVARELMPVRLGKEGVLLSPGGDGNNQEEVTDSDDSLPRCAVLEGMDALVSQPNYSSKRGAFLLFINNRLVDCAPMKRAIDSVYSTFLPRGTKPWCYIGITLRGDDLDVNVHPTKREVRFLHEEEVIEVICAALRRQLLKHDGSRTFYTQSSLSFRTIAPSSSASPGPSPAATTTNATMETSSCPASVAPQKPPYAPQRLVRTDHRAQTLDSFLQPIAASDSTSRSDGAPAQQTGSISDDQQENSGGISCRDDSNREISHTNKRKRAERSSAVPKRNRLYGESDSTPSASRSSAHSVRTDAQQRVMLTSVRNLLEAEKQKGHDGIRDICRNHTFVGFVDANLVLLQWSTRLYVVDMCQISRVVSYQRTLSHFASLPRITLAPPPLVRTLVVRALEEPDSGWEEGDGPREDIADYVANTILRPRREMLSEYFSIDIDGEGRLAAIPQIVKGYMPDLAFLHIFILRLGSEVEWRHEQRCFETVAEAIADFYALRPLGDQCSSPDEDVVPRAGQDDPSSHEETDNHASVEKESTPLLRRREHFIRDCLLPALRGKDISPPSRLADDGSVVEIACLERLYRVFERC